MGARGAGRKVYNGPMQVQKIIEHLGYKPNEAKVYLAALSLGECHVSDIAAKVRLPPSSTQAIVDKLHKDGLINFYVRKRYKYWVAENPELLLARLQEREEDVRAALPRIAALRHGREGKPTIEVFTGPEEIKFIHDDIIATKQPVSLIVAWDEWVALLGEGYIHDFIERRAHHFLKIRLIAPRTPVSLKLKERDAVELRETRFLPDGISVHTSNFIYGDKVGIISLNKKQPTGVLIRDPDVRDTMMIFFEELWQRSAR
jgi:sugar-specific transcriptional regulator TrmB